MSTETPLLNVQIDGVWLQFPKGTRVIEACRQAGKFVPHYCYHPKLSAPGNCRMCLIEMGMPKMGPDRKPILDATGKPEISWIPRPQISCAQDVSEGMAVRTESEMVKECRNGVMEFLLINHPLDCPICDQAGECRLQEFAVDFGKGESRFLEEKVKKPKNVELGPRVTLDDERCILCSRCIRFMREVAKDDVLGFVERGSYSTLTCHPDRVLDSNYSLNTVDICPVGALTSTDFRFKMRVWFLKETKSICTSCGTGCNTVIGSREETIHRQTPRQNDAVNECWMCDRGRLGFQSLASPERLLAPEMRGVEGNRTVSWVEAIPAAAAALRKNPGVATAMIASARMTNEEMWLASKLAGALRIGLVDVLPRPQEADGILVSADGNPNTRGAKATGLIAGEPGEQLRAIVSGIEDGTITSLLVLGEDAVACGVALEQLRKLDSVVTLGLTRDSTTPEAHVCLPGAGFAEKRGTMINAKGRLQRLNRAVAIPGEARDDWEILRDLITAVSGEVSFETFDDLFSAMTAAVPAFAGLTWGKIGDAGIELASSPVAEAAN